MSLNKFMPLVCFLAFFLNSQGFSEQTKPLVKKSTATEQKSQAKNTPAPSQKPAVKKIPSFSVKVPETVKKPTADSVDTLKKDTFKTHLDSSISKTNDSLHHADSVARAFSLDSICYKRESDSLDSVKNAHRVLPQVEPVVIPTGTLTVKKSNEGKKISRSVLLKIGMLLLGLVIIAFAMFFFLFRKKPTHFMTKTRLSIMDREIQLAARYVETNFADPNLTLDSLCAAIITGPAFLEALFMRDLGMGVNDFIKQVRINRAKLFLDKNPLLDAAELVAMCGYTDVALFAASFEHVTTISFVSYLQKCRSSAE